MKGRRLYAPNTVARSELTKQDYMKQDDTTTLNHFHEKLFKLKDLMKTQSGRKMAIGRHEFMEIFVKQFELEYKGQA